jgi:uncharacterized protein
MIDLSRIVSFDWDEGNARKSTERHDVSQSESEQIFFNVPLLLLTDDKHSQIEARYHALGRSEAGRMLHVTFTLRVDATSIRIISARDMHRKERKIYEQG